MCRRRYVTRSYTVCGHQMTTEESAPCENRFCKFSIAHPENCVPPECTTTCWQYRQYPEKYLLTKNERCPECSRGN